MFSFSQTRNQTAEDCELKESIDKAICEERTIFERLVIRENGYLRGFNLH